MLVQKVAIIQKTQIETIAQFHAVQSHVIMQRQQSGSYPGELIKKLVLVKDGGQAIRNEDFSPGFSHSLGKLGQSVTPSSSSYTFALST